MRMVTNRIQLRLPRVASLEFNPMHGLETPEETAFGSAAPHTVKSVGRGTLKPKHVTFKNGDEAITKPDAMSATFEPMAYHLGKQLGVSVPKTVTRQINGKTSSVQQRVPGVAMPLDYTHPDWDKVAAHPDFHKMGMFDWLTGNGDRHGENVFHDVKNDRVHAIDNGYMGDYFTTKPGYQMKDGNVVNGLKDENADFNLRMAGEHPIPADFRHAVMNADPEQHKAIINRYAQHPTFQQALATRRGRTLQPNYYQAFGDDHQNVAQHLANHYGDRLKTLQNHFADPEVQTMGDLHRRLYS